MSNSVAPVVRVEQLPAAPSPPDLPFIDLLSWVGRDAPDRSFLVPGLIPDSCVTSLYGDGGSGKTLLALSLMVAMASKYQSLWLGEKPLGWKSVGLFAEDDEAELVRRLQRICRAEKLEFAAIAANVTALSCAHMDATLATFSGGGGELIITPLMQGLLDRVRHEGASLLVIDYAAAVFGGNEIDRNQVSAFLRWLNAIAGQEQISILLLGHPSTSGMATGGRGTSGSTAWRNQARSFLHLTVDDTQNDPEDRRLLTLTLSKANYARAGRVFRLASDGARFDILADEASGPRRVKGPRIPASQKVALNALHEAISNAGEASPGGPIPAGVRVVRVDAWRPYAYSAGISAADTGEARRKAFQTARQALQDKGLVGISDPWAWVVEAGA
ncbi:hypothetical protein GCM10009101_11410 [Brevundimonas lenta]